MSKTAMNEAQIMLGFFRGEQAKYGIRHDSDGNIVRLKFDLRDIMDEIPQKHIKPLIRFYMHNSSVRTLQDFVYNYNSYYDSLVQYAKDNILRKNAAKQTIERLNEQRSTSN